MLFSSFLDAEEDHEGTSEASSFSLPFEIPRNFLNPDRFDPGVVPEEVLDSVPTYIGDTIFEHLGPEVPLDPLSVFLSLRHGGLPEFVVGYFLSIQKKKSLSNQTKFYRAIWFIHKFREHMILPPLHFLAFDTAAVQAVGRLAGADAPAGVPPGGHGPAVEDEEPVGQEAGAGAALDGDLEEAGRDGPEHGEEDE